MGSRVAQASDTSRGDHLHGGQARGVLDLGLDDQAAITTAAAAPGGRPRHLFRLTEQHVEPAFV